MITKILTELKELKNFDKGYLALHPITFAKLYNDVLKPNDEIFIVKEIEIGKIILYFPSINNTTLFEKTEKGYQIID